MSRLLKLVGGLANRVGSFGGGGGKPNSAPMRAGQEAIAEATKLVQSAVADLEEASRNLHIKGGLVGGVMSLGETGYNKVASNEGGPTLKDAGTRLGHDGRYPARDLVSTAMDKYEEAQQYVTDLPDIECAEIKAPKSKKDGRRTSIILAVAGVRGPIGMIVKASRQRKATRNVDEMLEVMKGVLADLLAQQQYLPSKQQQYNQQHGQPQQQYNQQYGQPQQYNQQPNQQYSHY